VVFKFLHAGFAGWKAHLDWERLYQIAALGTVADVAPLVDENRVITKVGIHFLGRKPDPALAALLEVAGVEPGQSNAGHLSFQIAPRLNAAGRMGSPEIGRRLLLSKDPGEIRELAGYLNKLNHQRRSLQADIYDQSVAMIESDLAKYLGNVIVVAGEGWNKGIVGIVAAKIQERYYRPTVVIALDGNDGSGSARSIPGFDLFSAISRCSSSLLRFGGHKAAAGLSIDRGRIDEFRDRFDRATAELLGEDDLVPKLAIDAELSISEVGLKLIDELTSLEPFGMGNRRPVFSSSAVALSGSPVVMGKKKNHLKIKVGGGDNTRECVGWDMAHRIDDIPTDMIDVAYQLKADEWRNRRRVQMILKDFRESMTGEG